MRHGNKQGQGQELSVTKILLVDSQQMVCQGIEQLLTQEGGYTVVTVDSDARALGCAREHSPDRIILDYHAMEVDGVSMIQQLRQIHSYMPIIGLSAIIEPLTVTRMLQAGMNAYISKYSPFTELLQALARQSEDEVHLCPLVAHKIALYNTVDNESANLLAELSERELQVMQMITQGKTVAQIAAKLFISAKTVCSYRYRLFAKLQVKNDVELTRLVLQYQDAV
jgi:two-component system invasion response regulator UvrY